MDAKVTRRRILAVFTLLFILGDARARSLPELSFQDLSGRDQSLSTYNGRILVLNFWATWCIPCREEMPMLNRLATQYGGRDVVFLSVSLDDSEARAKIPRFLGKKKIGFRVWVGATPDTLRTLGLGGIIPATIIFDRDGSAISRIVGEASRKDITSRLDWLLAEKHGTAPKPLVKHLP
jgi:thiol-disulfide isomerase/thioredoxin